jgi:Asp/Glu/hydantoin racemase
MAQKVVLIHTVPPLVGVFADLGRRALPGAALSHILDEPLLEHVRQRGGIGGDDVQRLLSHVVEAAAIGANVALVTCSTISQAVDQVRPQAPIPVVKIDEAMAAQAVRIGRRLAVVATNRTTLEPTHSTLEEAARDAGMRVEIAEVYVDGALDALLAGEGVRHDDLVAAAVQDLAGSCDVVVLAQASMARVLDAPQLSGYETPVLASPPLALEQVRTLLQAPALPAVAAGEQP